MPADVRSTLIGWAKALGANAAQLERLIAWETGAPCDAATAEAR